MILYRDASKRQPSLNGSITEERGTSVCNPMLVMQPLPAPVHPAYIPPADRATPADHPGWPPRSPPVVSEAGGLVPGTGAFDFAVSVGGGTPILFTGYDHRKTD